MKPFKKHNHESEFIIDYAVLLFSFAVAGLLIKALRLSHEYILLATVPMSIGYVVWGILHHKRHGHVDKKIILEYLTMAILVNVIIGVLII